MTKNKSVIHFAHANGIPSPCYRKVLGNLEADFDVKMIPVTGADPRYPINNNWHSTVEEIANSIREKCTQPVIGMGHSMGGLCTFFAAQRYPELFSSIVIMDPPVINGFGAIPFGLMKLFGMADRITPAGKSAGRRETWPSREVARESLGKKKFFQAFDSECFDDYLSFGLTDYTEGVRLTVSAATEVAIFRNTPSDYWSYRPALKVPGVLLSGAQSEFGGTGFAERMARQHHLLHMHVEGGHMFPLEKPLLTVEAIRVGLQQIKML
jgi:pimeloyl-ACP methyl ester carboxylesterase